MLLQKSAVRNRYMRKCQADKKGSNFILRKKTNEAEIFTLILHEKWVELAPNFRRFFPLLSQEDSPFIHIFSQLLMLDAVERQKYEKRNLPKVSSLLVYNLFQVLLTY